MNAALLRGQCANAPVAVLLLPFAFARLRAAATLCAMQFTKSLTGGLLLAASLTVLAQRPNTTNYDEAKVGNLPLPDPLICLDGSKVTDAKTWASGLRLATVNLTFTGRLGSRWSPALAFMGNARQRKDKASEKPGIRMDVRFC